MAVSGGRLARLGADLGAFLASVRRLSAVADQAGDPEAIFTALAAELSGLTGAEEIHIHHLAGQGAEMDRVSIYLFGGDGRVSHLRPVAERSSGIEWAASTGKSLVAGTPEELAAIEPGMAQLGERACGLLVPIVVRGESEGVVLLLASGPEAFAEQGTDLTSALVEQAATGLALVRARIEAGTDPVTGAMNRRAMRRRLQEEIGRATRGRSELACMLIDLDNFKLVNDRHGHGTGDELLREVARALVGEFRAFDRVARYGGDEFVVIMPNAGLDAAVAAAGRALERLRSLAHLEAGAAAAASIGVAAWHAPMSAEALLESCDGALLRSKREGKGRVTRAL